MSIKELERIEGRGGVSVGHHDKQASVSLSDRIRGDFFAIVESSLHINTQDEFFKWTQNELQGILPHGKLACGIGVLGKHGVQIRHFMGCNFPDEYVQSLQREDGLTSSPIILRWMKERQPVLFEPDCSARYCSEIKASAPPGWLENFRHYGLVNLAAHGLCDADNHTVSYFSFSCIPAPLSQRHAHLLKLLVPHLHVALSRVIANSRFDKKRAPKQKVSLSAREKEVLRWMSCGKSNWEIAQVIGLSESTVKHHVHHILGKLQVATRTQAVAKAISIKLISSKH